MAYCDWNIIFTWIYHFYSNHHFHGFTTDNTFIIQQSLHVMSNNFVKNNNVKNVMSDHYSLRI